MGTVRTFYLLLILIGIFIYIIVKFYSILLQIQMNSDTGKWNWNKIKEFADLMENDLLKSEATIIQKSCFDGNFFFNLLTYL